MESTIENEFNSTKSKEVEREEKTGNETCGAQDLNKIRWQM